MENAGVEGSIVVGKLRESKDENFGFNAQTEEYVDMVKAGIIDPVKVVRIALQDAASVAGLIITTEASIAEAPKKDNAGGGGMPAAAWAAAWAAWISNPVAQTQTRKRRSASSAVFVCTFVCVGARAHWADGESETTSACGASSRQSHHIGCDRWGALHFRAFRHFAGRR